MDSIFQTAPKPVLLQSLVDRLTYKGWRIYLTDMERGQDSNGTTLVINADVPDSYHSDRLITVAHLFPVPPAAYDERSWTRWLLDQILLVEQHEACEFFCIDGDRPYAPHHGPGNNPYTIFDHGTDEDVRTASSGKVKPA